MKLKNRKSGFTLLEIIIVIIIVGVLASLALPRLFNTIEYSRSTEALNSIAVIKRSADRCAIAIEAAQGIPDDFANCDTFADIGIDDPSTAAGASFTYAMAFAAPVYTITATRNGSGDTIALTYDVVGGTFTRTGTGAFSGLK